MKWADLVNLSIITQIESNFPNVFGRPTTKSIVILSHFHSGMGILWSVLLGLWCSYFTCWQFGHLATKSTMSRFILLHQKCFFRSRYILVAPGCIEYLELCASVRIVLIKSSTRGTHTLPLILKTPSSSICASLASPHNTISRIRLSFSSSNCFPLILSRKEDLASAQANNPPFSFILTS